MTTTKEEGQDWSRHNTLHSLREDDQEKESLADRRVTGYLNAFKGAKFEEKCKIRIFFFF